MRISEPTRALLLVDMADVFWDGRPCATKREQCEKDGNAYIERVRGSERGFEHLTKCEDMVISQDGHVLSLFRYPLFFSS